MHFTVINAGSATRTAPNTNREGLGAANCVAPADAPGQWSQCLRHPPGWTVRTQQGDSLCARQFTVLVPELPACDLFRVLANWAAGFASLAVSEGLFRLAI
jgi:hypothetical protein